MSLDKNLVRNIAFLARIGVPEEDLGKFSDQLGNIIDWVEQLSEVDTDGVEPMTSGSDLSLPWRTDEITDGGYQDKVTANAPDAIDGFFGVPKMVE